MVNWVMANVVTLIVGTLVFSWSHAQNRFQVETGLTVTEYNHAFVQFDDLPDLEVLGDPEAYSRVKAFLAADDWSRVGGRETVVLENAAAGAGERLCAGPLDGQKLRIAGGNATWGPAAFQVEDSTVHPQTIWVFDSLDMLVSRGIDLESGPDQTLVIIDDFGFDAMGVESDLDFHGNAILHHVLQLLRGSRSEDALSIDSFDFDGATIMWSEIEVTLAGGETARIVLVDFDFDVSLLAAAIELAASQTQDDSAAAVNLSWNLVPCAFLDQQEEGMLVYESYVHFLWELAKDPANAEFFVELYMLFEGVPEFEESEQAVFNFRVILAAAEEFANRTLDAADPDSVIDASQWFGSAGNQGLGFPLPPATFSNVMSVAACEVSGETDALGLARWSNAGRVSTMGAWFIPAAGLPPYGGSSFAAPLAALLRLHLQDEPTAWPMCTPLGLP